LVDGDFERGREAAARQRGGDEVAFESPERPNA
jgi:hypothetical protein